MRLNNFQVKATATGRFKLGDLPRGYNSTQELPLEDDQSAEVASAQQLIDNKLAILMILDFVAEEHSDTHLGQAAAILLTKLT